jgi:hypothetical protein
MNWSMRRYSGRFRTWIWTSTSSWSRKTVSWNSCQINFGRGDLYRDLLYICSSMSNNYLSVLNLKIISQIKDIGSDPDGLKKS